MLDVSTDREGPAAQMTETSYPEGDRPAGRGGPVCFVFLDGVGLGPASGSNPFVRASMPALRRLLDGPLVLGPPLVREQLLFLPMDACLGVAGLPQSATGQTALFTGLNAPALVGAHVPAHPSHALRDVIAEHSILKRATEMGLRATFANAYTDSYWRRAAHGKLRHSASTLTAGAALLRFRTMDDLAQGRAIYWDITHKVMHLVSGRKAARVQPEESGRRLARLAASHDLVLFESFLTDLAGHRRLPWPTEEVLSLIDRFLAGLLSTLADGSTLVLASDHGNVEDSSTRSHTANPVPLLVVGPGATAFRGARAITDVAPSILRWLGGWGWQRNESPDQHG